MRQLSLHEQEATSPSRARRARRGSKRAWGGALRERFDEDDKPRPKEDVTEPIAGKGNKYRTHKNDELRPEHVGQPCGCPGWVHRKRDHGQLLFIDLRDHYGITQCVFTPNSEAFKAAEAVRVESVVHVSGRVLARTGENVNPSLPTGDVEVVADTLDVLSPADTLPFQVAGTQEIPEEQRLRFRFSTFGARRFMRTSCCGRR